MSFEKRIVAEVERRLSVTTANLSHAERLRQARNGRAFTGQLVPQSEVMKYAS